MRSTASGAAGSLPIYVIVAWLAASAVATGSLRAANCANLGHLKLPQATVTLARVQAAGTFLPPNLAADDPAVQLYRKLPAFCRVTAELKPSSDSLIEVEVWMPLAKWNRRFRGMGNGGFAGAIDYRGLAGSVLRGYAAAATDAGHKGEATDANWALGHPEKVTDFGYRAIHEMTEKARAVVRAFYRQAPQRRYFDSCSDGGREALMEAQRFPNDYDGILAGAPANDWTHLLTSGLDLLQKTQRTRPQSFIPPDDLNIITQAVLHACDAQDEVRDGILNDPRKCRFRPGEIQCGDLLTQACLQPEQVKAVEAYYAGGKTTEGQQIFPGLMPSSEAGDGGWANWVTGKTPDLSEDSQYVTGFFRNMVYEDSHWDFNTANVDEALAAANKKLAGTLNATDADLSRFRARGGKLILYHGWLDPAISPLNSIDYYGSVSEKMGRAAAASFLQLYMVPGMRHCAGGPGPFIFGQLGIGSAHDPEHSMFAALEQWVEQGKAPLHVVATKLVDDKDPAKGVKLTRPLCPYPQVARYTGKGNPDDAGEFVCSEPEVGEHGESTRFN